MMRFPADRLFCIAILFMVTIPIAVCGVQVTRSLSTTEPEPGEIFSVSLSTKDMPLGGIVEILPDGYTFVRTEHPDDRILTQKEKVAFAITDENMINYSVRAPASGSGDIIGTWEDFVAETSGEIPPSRVAVSGVEASGAGDPTPTEAQPAGLSFTLLTAAAAILIVTCRGGRR